MFKWFKEWEAYVARQIGLNVKAHRTDKGGEYVSNAMTKYFADLGIANEYTQAGSPQSNGVAQRFNQTLLEVVRCMLHSTGTHKDHGVRL